MNNLKNFLILLCFLFSYTVSGLDSEKAKSFVIDIGNQAIKILKIPVDDKQKRKNELQNLLQEKFDMQLISKVILGSKVTKSATSDQLNKFSKGLRSTKYFDNWTQENLDDTVTWRFED